MDTLPSTTAVGRVGAAGCVDGLVSIPSEDGPTLTACLAPCCTQRRAEARAQRTAALAGRDPFARLPQADDEEW